MQIYSKTDIGLVRDVNQDACRYGELSENCVWAVVCDGMGGENGGNVASKIAVETVSNTFLNDYDDEYSNDKVSEMIIKAVQTANKKIHRESKSDMALAGMGTTSEVAFLKENSLFLAHVGDSRAYIMRNGVIKQVTKDHSVVQELIESGEITPEQAANHPNKNLITRALGVEEDVRIDFIEAEFEQGDILVLTTDGLTNYVSESELADVLSSIEISSACEKLVDMAKKAGGSDNITVTIITA